MKAVIIDDDILSGELISRFLAKIEFITLQKNFTDPVKALSYLHTNRTDLIFLDIEMPGMNGMDFLRTIKNSPALVILVTSHKEFALEAFEFKVLDYLVKPFTYARFFSAVSRAMPADDQKEKEDRPDDIVFVKKDSKMIRIRISDILWAEAMGDYSVLHTGKDKFVLHCTLKVVEGKLPVQAYLRVHRSYIIKIDAIEKVEDNMIFGAAKPIPIGKSYREDVFRRLKMF